MIAVIVAVAISTLQPSTQHFAGNAEPLSIEVRHEDLNLLDPASVDQLRKRIERAVTRVCPVEDLRNLAARSKIMRCRKEARDRAFLAVERLVSTRNGR